jgi:hypothetical protein
MKSFAEEVKTFVKSLAGGEPQGNDEDDLNHDDEGKGQEGAGEGGGEGEGEDVQKGLVDATGILNSLVAELNDVNKSLKTIIAGQDDVGGAIVGVAEMVNRIANTPLPTKSAMAKSIPSGGVPASGAGGGAFPRAVQPNERPTQEEFERAQDILIKSFRNNEITLQKSEMISSDLQKAMRIPGYKMNPEYYNFLAAKMRTA